MAYSISQSVGKGGVNLANDVKTIQHLLNAKIKQISPLAPLAEDGKCGPLTTRAIEEFQRKVVKLSIIDGRADVGGRTFQSLTQGAPQAPPATSPAPPATGTFRVVFQHGGTVPEPTSSTKGTAGLYESKVTVTGPRSGSYRGSIYPDDLGKSGRLKDGSYDLYIGFHRRDGSPTPTTADLVVRDNKFRAALIVNADKCVPVISDKPGKTTGSSIHIHNGFNSKRYSEGCPTLSPTNWPSFIKLFLDTYPTLASWTETSTYVGKKVGQLEVRT